ncbi:MAG: ABC transporter permease subunit [Leptospiraceae bacterium]|nr:ABC transporter permease subunit [Leptospiraceae bacterium]
MTRSIPLILIFTLCAIGILFFLPPTKIDLDQSFCLALTLEHPLGCDRMGRDNFALLSYGILITILVSIPARLLTLLVSLSFSLIVSYSPKQFEKVFQSFIFVFLSVPSLLVALIVITVFESSIWSFLLAIVFSDWAQSFEPMQIKIREVLESGYVLNSKNLGASQIYIFYRHVLPELKMLFWTLFQTGLPSVIMTVSIFSYFGLDIGASSFGPGLGEQISFSKDFVHISFLPVLFPILGIMGVVLSFEMIQSKKF